jgi:DNA-binding NarL/FixJ family response regulator
MCNRTSWPRNGCSVHSRARSAVKFHVSNILRKLSAGNRAEAVARYLRASMRTT